MWLVFFKEFIALLSVLSFLFVMISTLVLFGFKSFNSAFNKLITKRFTYNVKIIMYNMTLIFISIILVSIEILIIQFLLNKAQPSIQDVEISIGCNFLFLIINFITFKLSTKVLNYKFTKTKMYLSYTTANKVKLNNKNKSNKNKIKQNDYDVNKRNFG